MNKSTVIVVILALTCAYGLHMQTFAPSRPGGNYIGTNGTQSYTPSNTQINNQNLSSTSTILVNGRPYTYTGPFRLVCYVVNSNQVFRQDRCSNANYCAQILNDYKNCLGNVVKYPIM